MSYADQARARGWVRTEPSEPNVGGVSRRGWHDPAADKENKEHVWQDQYCMQWLWWNPVAEAWILTTSEEDALRAALKAYPAIAPKGAVETPAQDELIALQIVRRILDARFVAIAQRLIVDGRVDLTGLEVKTTLAAIGVIDNEIEKRRVE